MVQLQCIGKNKFLIIITITTEIDCPADKQLNERGQCVCGPGTALNIYNECVVCDIYKGYKVENGHCVCALERGMIIDERGNCICPEEHGYRLTSSGNCVLEDVPECQRNDDCPDDRYCKLETKTCENPCDELRCGVNAFCNATNHAATCKCITDYTGDPYTFCSNYTPSSTFFFYRRH
jgi:hypothetical protein